MAKPVVTETVNETKITDEWGDSLVVANHINSKGERRVTVHFEMKNDVDHSIVEKFNILTDFPEDEFWRYIAETRLKIGADK